MFDGIAPIARKEFQLVALTSLYLAIKAHGEARADPGSDNAANVRPWNRLTFSLPVCASISRGSFGVTEIAACELSILTSLNWRINPVVPSGTVVDCLVAHLPRVLRGCSSGGADGRNSSLSLTEGDVECVKLHVYDCAKYLAELSVSVPALCLVYRPSVVSYASVLVAFDTLVVGRTPAAAPRGAVVSRRQRSEYEDAVGRASGGYYAGSRTEDVDGAARILGVICPNLMELFPTPALVGGGGCASNKNDNDEALLLSPTTSATVV